MKHDPRLSIDLSRLWEHGFQLVVENLDMREKRDRTTVMWRLLEQAAQVSRSWPAPPRTGLPSATIGMDGPDEVSEWQRALQAFQVGETVSTEYGIRPRTQWSAFEQSAAEYTLRLFHAHAFADLGAKRKLRAAVLAYAGGMPPRKIRALTGMNPKQLTRARDRATKDMLAAFDAAHD